MSSLSGGTRSDYTESINSDDEEPTELTGWDFEIPKTDRQLEKFYIKKANDSVSLKSILSKYGLTFHNPHLKWDKCLCPFKDHNESTPSFGYNNKSDSFYCFGCQRLGRAVEFISYYESKDKLRVAKSLFTDNVNIADALIFEEDYNKKIEVILFDFASKIRYFIKSNNYSNACIKYSENVSIGIDIFIQDMISKHKVIREDQLITRINLMMNYLGRFKQ